jgi:hypothetical protein
MGSWFRATNIVAGLTVNKSADTCAIARSRCRASLRGSRTYTYVRLMSVRTSHDSPARDHSGEKHRARRPRHLFVGNNDIDMVTLE